MTDPFAQSAHDKFLLEEDIKMAARNAQPARQGGMKVTPNHQPHKAGTPATSVETGNAGPGQGHTKPIVTKGTGKNANKLH
jgi:hypothetical protein